MPSLADGMFRKRRKRDQHADVCFPSGALRVDKSRTGDGDGVCDDKLQHSWRRHASSTSPFRIRLGWLMLSLTVLLFQVLVAPRIMILVTALSSKPIQNRPADDSSRTNVLDSSNTFNVDASSRPLVDLDPPLQLDHGYDFLHPHLTIQSFNMDLQQIALEDPQRAQDILERAEQEALLNNNMIITPDSASYHSVIEGWCQKRQAPLPAAAVVAPSNDDVTMTILPEMAAQNLLDRMEARQLSPNSLSYLVVCEKWATARPLLGQNMDRARKILDRYVEQMVTEQQQRQQQRQLEQQQQQEQHQQSPALRRRVKATTTSSSKQYLPALYPPGNLVRLYCILLEGWCRLMERDTLAKDRIEELLQEMEAGRDNGRPVRPNVLAYTSVLTALSRSKQPDMGRKADALIQRMKDNHVEPDLVAYTAALSCWSKATSRVERKMSSKRALELLHEIEDAYLDRRLIKPSPITYGTAIMAIARSFDPNSATLAEDVLRRMYNLTEAGTILIPPTTSCWNAVIYAHGSNGNAHQAEALLLEMIDRSRQNGEIAVEPSIKTWGGVLRAWAESGQRDAGEEAQRVLDMLEDDYKRGNSELRPNYVCYSTVLQAFARGKAPPEVTLKKVNSILRKMESTYEETRDDAIRPNTVTYVTAMDVFCRCSPTDCGSMSQDLVDRMVQLYAKGIGFERPSLVVMNTLINAWSRSREPFAPQNAEKIFRWMEQNAMGDGSMKPNEITLCNVLNAWANNAKNGGAARAQHIMDHFEAMPAEERGILTVQPFNVLIKAWGRSGAADSVERAERILLLLEDRYGRGDRNLEPDITTYSSVINSAAYYSGGKDGNQDAFQVAFRTYERIKESSSLVANNIVFGTLFKAIGKLTVFGKPRDRLIKDAFHECCKEGQVDYFVLSQLKFCSHIKLYRELVLRPCGIQDKNAAPSRILAAMPTFWGRNVP